MSLSFTEESYCLNINIGGLEGSQTVIKYIPNLSSLFDELKAWTDIVFGQKNSICFASFNNVYLIAGDNMITFKTPYGQTIFRYEDIKFILLNIYEAILKMVISLIE